MRVRIFLYLFCQPKINFKLTNTVAVVIIVKTIKIPELIILYEE